MLQISNEQFEGLVASAIEAIAEPYKSRIENIAFIIEDEPTQQQRQKTNLHFNQTLLGLYEGVPLPQRGGQTKLLPDKITLFKTPLLMASTDAEALRENIAKTIWHEVAHYFGLDHHRIHELGG